jgi:quercetin dioxygenase-like cupin family protein
MKPVLMGTIVFAGAMMPACVFAGAQAAPAVPASGSQGFPYEQMSVTTNPNGSERRMVFAGTLKSGEVVMVRESTQPAGTPAPLLHTIQHSEILVVREGAIEFQHDGKAERLGPGGVAYVALGTPHAIKNVGEGAAKYVVIQIGGDTKPSSPPPAKP